MNADDTDYSGEDSDGDMVEVDGQEAGRGHTIAYFLSEGSQLIMSGGRHKNHFGPLECTAH